MKQTAAKGSTAKHAGTSKHGKTVKHAPARQKWTQAQQRSLNAWVARQPSHPKPRALALGEAWPCCSAEALGASLRLAGWPVTDDDVLGLHVAAGGSQDRGVPILAVLEAASEHGLGDVRPLSFNPLRPLVASPDGFLEGDLEAVQGPEEVGQLLRSIHPASVILGVELPGAHAVTVAPDGCWLSWGGHRDPAGWPGAAIEETWRVTWPAAGTQALRRKKG